MLTSTSVQFSPSLTSTVLPGLIESRSVQKDKMEFSILTFEDPDSAVILEILGGGWAAWAIVGALAVFFAGWGGTAGLGWRDRIAQERRSS